MGDALMGDAVVRSARGVADVITLPVRAGRSAHRHANDLTSEVVDRTRSFLSNEVDDWGRDAGFVQRVQSLSYLRWGVSVGGAEHIPRRAGALVVVNSRRLALAPVFTALSLGRVSGRTVRFVGRPDIAPLGPMMQRLGGLLPIEDEVEGALRAGEVVVLGANHELTNQRSGVVDHRLVGAAVATRTRVLPAAAISAPLRRHARVEVGPPLRLSRQRRGPLAELELADLAAERIDAMLSEFGETFTGTVLDLLPALGIGGF